MTPATILLLFVYLCFSFTYLQRPNRKAIHVVPEDQRAQRPSGGDDGSLQVSAVTVASVGAVCTQIPTLGAAAIRKKATKNIGILLFVLLLVLLHI